MLETTAKTGEAYLQAQSQEGLRLGHKNVGKNVEELLRVCADTPDRLAATRAAALIKASLLTGFRNCGIIHMTWANLLYRQADQRIVPHAFDILGVGISKHKTNRTGKS
ncbi:hypothetical protein WJX77_004451 [Trebouxia sp. C0004]